MAEVVGLAASIIQIAGAGAKLSVALCNFANSAARADQDIKDIADDVELTSNALASVGKVFESEDARSIVSKKAIQDANNIIKKCQGVFNEVSEMVKKRRKIGKDGKKSLSTMGKLVWPMKEQRVELNRRRLESLKNSLVLLLHVLQLAQGQSRGKVDKSFMEEERDKIRELHQRQQDSLKSLQALESKFYNITFDGEETLQGSSTSSHVPTLELLADTRAIQLPPLEKDVKLEAHTITVDLSGTDTSDTSDSDATMTDEDDENITIEELSTAAKQVTKLLKRITELQKSLRHEQRTHRKRHVHKLYQHFCRKFELGINLAQAACASAYESPVTQSLDQANHAFEIKTIDGGTLENFDFDRFLHVQSESTPFLADDFDFDFNVNPPAQQQTNDMARMSPALSYQYSLATPTSMVDQVPSGTAYVQHYSTMHNGVMVQQSQEAGPNMVSQHYLPPSRGMQQRVLSQTSHQEQAQAYSLARTEMLRRAATEASNQSAIPPEELSGQFDRAYSAPTVNPETDLARPRGSTLHDYQHALMILEHQNNERVLIARQEQDLESQPGTTSVRPTQSEQDAQQSSLKPSPTSNSQLAPATTSIGSELRGNKAMDIRRLSSSDNGWSDVALGHGDRNSYDHSDSFPIIFKPSQPIHIRTTSSPSGTWEGATRPQTIPKDKDPVVKQEPLQLPDEQTSRHTALSMEQKSQTHEMRKVEACINCRTLRLKCDHSAPCNNCTKRNARQESLPSGICRGSTIAEHSQDLPIKVENAQISPYEESDVENLPENKSLTSVRGRKADRKRSHVDVERPRRSAISAVSTTGRSRKKLAVEWLASDDEMEQDNDQSSRRKRPRIGNEDNGFCSEDMSNVSLEPSNSKVSIKVEETPESTEKDIVDVLLEQWTVPVY